MTRADVITVLSAAWVPRWEQTLAGFEFKTPALKGIKSEPDWRLSKGSGIASDDRWFLRAIQDPTHGFLCWKGPTMFGPVRTKRGLHRILTEWMAWSTGESRPPDREGYTVYAKLNHNRHGDFFVWCYRKRQSESRKRALKTTRTLRNGKVSS